MAAIQKRQPFLQFYPDNWLGETRLKMCSRQARSLWFDMLMVMHSSEPRGFLLVEGIAPNVTQLAQLVGDAPKDVTRWLSELLAAGVYSFIGGPLPEDVEALVPAGLPDGTILSRKMVRDTARARTARERGEKGGNPALIAAIGISGGLTDGVNQDGTRAAPKRRRWDKPEGDTSDNLPLKPPDKAGEKPQSPESRNQRIPPCPPSAAVKPFDPSWEPWREKALETFGSGCCTAWLFPCRIEPLADGRMALEAPSTWMRNQIEGQCGGPKLHAFFGEGYVIRIAKTGASECGA